MGEFAVDAIIEAPIGAVWDRLAEDIGSIVEWNPGVEASHLTSNKKQGLGACRHCDLGGNNYLNEEVVTFVEQTAVTFRIIDTNLPFSRADIRFSLEAMGGSQTKVTCSPLYKLKYGLLGEMLDMAMVRRQYRGGMNRLLTGLKGDIETSQ